jgi:hypothetical protein
MPILVPEKNSEEGGEGWSKQLEMLTGDERLEDAVFSVCLHASPFLIC